MKLLHFHIHCVLLVCLMAGCTVMSREVEDQALPQLNFNELIAQADQYRGQTVILGGYVLSVDNLDKQTRIVAVQAPLGVGQQPKSKDLSQGRLILIIPGFVDPEVYTKDRQITVGGKVVSSSVEDSQSVFPYLKIEVQDIHLWPVPKPVTDDPYWYDDFWYPYPWGWRHPYWRHHYR